jgi:AcrR family transcriptional regulator
MARPREFDEDEVLARAMMLFWEKGYESTSLGDLEAATRLSRPSLYAAFGDKEGLFLKVLQRFATRYAGYDELLSSAPSVRAGFEQLFESWLEENCRSSGPRGCLFQLAQSTGGPALPRASKVLAEGTAATEAMFRRAVERAHRSRELVGGSPTAQARTLYVGLHGLSAATRFGYSRRELEPVIKLLLDGVFGPNPHVP